MILRLTRNGKIDDFPLHSDYEFKEFDHDINQAIDLSGKVQVLLANEEIYEFTPAECTTIAVVKDIPLLLPPTRERDEPEPEE